MSGDKDATSLDSCIYLPQAGMVLDLGKEDLLDATGNRVELRPQAFRVLRYLALNAGRVVTKKELHEEVWPDAVVTDDSLVQAVSDLRHVLGDMEHILIKTVPRRGYELVAGAMVRHEKAANSAKNLQVLDSSEPLATKSAAPGFLVWPWAMLALVVLLGVAISVLPLREQSVSVASPQNIESTPEGIRLPMPDRPSIAVLAFRAPGGSESEQLLARGVAEELISELARNVDLRVVSWYSSFRFAGQDVPLEKIGQRLRSHYLVDGTVQRDGELLSVSVQMIDSSDSHLVWSTEYSTDSGEVLMHRDQIVARIAGSLHSKMRQTEERRALVRPPKNLDVYEMTLRAIALKHRFTAKATREARSLLNQVIEIDPGYAPGWLYLGMLNAIDSLIGLTGEWTPERYEEMLAQSQRAIQLDPQLPAAYFGLAITYLEGRRFKAALEAVEHCVVLGPGDADCLQYLAGMQIRLGLLEPAMASIESALELSPIPPAYVIHKHALVLWAHQRLDEALQRADECIEQAPGFLECRKIQLWSLVESGRIDAARVAADTILTQFPAASADWFRMGFDESATELRARVTKAALAAGLPEDADPPAVTKLSKQ
ncbi:winged helix-turn-helix domain-containing tetratricopeptide repeat protein [Neptunomonas qingdaonensis]|nr:winged helix-turn-helix domain-containing protein [Neptunomonas qingdaonensis]